MSSYVRGVSIGDHIHPEVIRGGQVVTVCDNPIRHSPRPQRIIGHHRCPQACGGQTTDDNIMALCDNCHMNSHIGMWVRQFLGEAAFKALHLSDYLVTNALIDWEQAVALGTANKIPKEGNPIS